MALIAAWRLPVHMSKKFRKIWRGRGENFGDNLLDRLACLRLHLFEAARRQELLRHSRGAAWRRRAI